MFVSSDTVANSVGPTSPAPSRKYGLFGVFKYPVPARQPFERMRWSWYSVATEWFRLTRQSDWMLNSSSHDEPAQLAKTISCLTAVRTDGRYRAWRAAKRVPVPSFSPRELG
jgi:hypothetical protein